MDEDREALLESGTYPDMPRKSNYYRRLSNSGANDNGSLDSSSQHLHNQRILVKIKFRDLIRVTVALPFFSFIFNVFYVLHEDFEGATNTHCHSMIVRNSLPSFSSAVGDFPLARAIWHIAIALHAAPRLLFVAMTYRRLEFILSKKYLIWARVVYTLGLIENFGLIGLTYVSSKDHFPTHMWSFISFILCSEFYMLIYCTLISGNKYRNIQSQNYDAHGERESKSLRLKWQLFVVNVTFAILSALAYARHVTYCEEGVYTYFAFFEYIVVFTNIGFHGTAYWDFYERELVI